MLAHKARHKDLGRRERRLRRQQFGGATPAGSSRVVRLDPLALPIRFTASDPGADERIRWVELDRERVVLRRAVRGIPMAIKVPLNAFLGVALHLVAGEDGSCAALSLEHRDPALSVPLASPPDGDDVIADWRLWARILRLPLLVADSGGLLREPVERMGGVRLEPVCPRRRRRNAIKARRPSIPLRRALGRDGEPMVHRGEREIIARD
jgi:hypothetical protein